MLWSNFHITLTSPFSGRSIRQISRSQKIVAHGPHPAHYLIFVNKVLPEHSQAYLFTYCATMTELIITTQSICPAKLKVFTIEDFTEKKKIADPWIRVSQECFQKLIRKVLTIILMRHYQSLIFNRVSQTFSIIGPQYSPFLSALNQNQETFC